MTFKKKISILAASLLLAGTAGATVVDIDVTGAEGWGLAGDPSNTILNVDIGSAIGCPGCEITIDALGWDVGITANGLSWYSEATVLLENSDQTAGVELTPGVADGFAGGGVENAYSSGGLLDLIGLDLDFMLLSDGILRLEFTDTFEDNEMPDSVWSGTSSVNASTGMAVSEPGILMLFGLGLIGAVVARKRLA